MAVSITLSLAGYGASTRYSGDLRQLGRVESKLPESHSKRSPLGWLHCKCFWQIHRSKNLHWKSRNLLTLRMAHGKEAEDSFTQVLIFSSQLTNAHKFYLCCECVFSTQKNEKNRIWNVYTEIGLVNNLIQFTLCFNG